MKYVKLYIASRLPRSVLGRILLGIVCMVFLPATATALIAYLFIIPVPNRPVAWAVAALFSEFVFAAFLFSAFGLIWAVAMPQWAIRVIEMASLKLLIGYFIFCTAVAVGLSVIFVSRTVVVAVVPFWISPKSTSAGSRRNGPMLRAAAMVLAVVAGCV